MTVSGVIQRHEWIQQFELKFKSRPFEQFSLLLCQVPDTYTSSDSPKTLEEKQLRALFSLLFSSTEEQDLSSYDKSIDSLCSKWKEYLECTFSLYFPDKKLQLQRLVNKCLEILEKVGPQKDLKDNFDYLFIHMQSAKLKK